MEQEGGTETKVSLIAALGFIGCYAVWLSELWMLHISWSRQLKTCTLGPDRLERTFLPPSKGSTEHVTTPKKELCLLPGSYILLAQRQMSVPVSRALGVLHTASSILVTDALQLFTCAHLFNPGITLNLRPALMFTITA